MKWHVDYQMMTSRGPKMANSWP